MVELMGMHLLPHEFSSLPAAAHHNKHLHSVNQILMDLQYFPMSSALSRHTKNLHSVYLNLMDLNAIEDVIKPDDVHYAQTKLICLENTHGGNYLPQAYQQDVRSICDKHKLSLHLDGARMFNACVA